MTTVFNDVFLPDSVIAADVRGKNMRLNSRIATGSGHETINVIWSRTLRQFEFGIIPMSIAAWRDIETLHEITEGGAYGFLMEDPKDHAVTGGVLTALGGGAYQLHKRYTDTGSGRTKDRIITRPKAGSVTITNNGSPVTFTLDATTGRATITGSPDVANLAWSGRFYLPVHFLEDSIDWEMVLPGSDERSLFAGPSVVLQEIRE